MITQIKYWGVILIAELTLTYINFKRYFFNTLSAIISFYLVFLAMFFGFKFFGGSIFDTSDIQQLDGIIIKYILWVFATMAYSGIANSLMNESQIGTLEQLYLSPAGFNARIFCRIIGTYISSYILVLFIFCLTMLTTGRWFAFPWVKIFCILTISLLSAFGIGYIMGGLAIVFKRMNAALNLVQAVFLYFVYMNAYPLNGFSFMPFSAGANAIIRIVVFKETIPFWWYGFITVNSLFYFFLGMGIYSLFEKRAMRLNLLSEY